MGEIDKRFINQVVGTIFPDNLHYLLSADSNHPIVDGVFDFTHRSHYKLQIPNLTELDQSFALAQLGFVAFAHWFRGGKFDYVDQSNPIRELRRVKIGDIHKHFGRLVTVDELVRARMEIGEFNEGEDSYLSEGRIYYNGGVHVTEFDVAILK